MSAFADDEYEDIPEDIKRQIIDLDMIINDPTKKMNELTKIINKIVSKNVKSMRINLSEFETNSTELDIYRNIATKWIKKLTDYLSTIADSIEEFNKINQIVDDKYVKLNNYKLSTNLEGLSRNTIKKYRLPIIPGSVPDLILEQKSPIKRGGTKRSYRKYKYSRKSRK
jgi:hypothetical protein